MQDKQEQQHFFMQKAIALAERGRFTAPPNPWVGCVIVKEGKIVGEGFHESVGKPHAEIVALLEAKEKAHGATMYVTLEPCVHYGKTPPCIKAILDSGIKEIVIGIEDPDPRIKGKGIEFLKKSSIKVTCGLKEEAIKSSLEPYLFQRHYARPYTLIKIASSLDGKIAAADGSSKWITGEKAREDGHVLRAYSQAVMIGSKTALLDSPQLTVRHVHTPKQPLRVVLDSKGIVEAKGALFDPCLAPTLIYTTTCCPSWRLKEWEAKQTEVFVFKEDKILLEKVLLHLTQKGVLQLLVEGGSTLQGHFLEKELVQKAIFYFGNCVIGPNGKSSIESNECSTILNAKRWSLENIERLDDTIKAEYRLGKK